MLDIIYEQLASQLAEKQFNNIGTKLLSYVYFISTLPAAKQNLINARWIDLSFKILNSFPLNYQQLALRILQHLLPLQSPEVMLKAKISQDSGGNNDKDKKKDKKKSKKDKKSKSAISRTDSYSNSGSIIDFLFNIAGRGLCWGSSPQNQSVADDVIFVLRSLLSESSWRSHILERIDKAFTLLPQFFSQSSVSYDIVSPIASGLAIIGGHINRPRVGCRILLPDRTEKGTIISIEYDSLTARIRTNNNIYKTHKLSELQYVDEIASNLDVIPISPNLLNSLSKFFQNNEDMHAEKLITFSQLRVQVITALSILLHHNPNVVAFIDRGLGTAVFDYALSAQPTGGNINPNVILQGVTYLEMAVLGTLTKATGSGLFKDNSKIKLEIKEKR